MVNTADLRLIGEWLAHPRPLDEEEQARVKDLLQQWPWFIPARYLKAGAAQAGSPFTSAMLGEMQLYSGNWLHFHQMMLEAAKTPQPAPEAVKTPAPEAAPLPPEEASPNLNQPLIQPVYTEDYFLHQGIRVDDSLPEEVQPVEDPKSLMVVMSFSEWLQFFRHKSQKEREEEADKRALKSHWQKEKLAAALEEEDDEIPETVFEMAVNSISREDGLVSESLAEILVKQGKREAAIDMYRKLSLRNPAKSAYFAAHIEKLQTENKA